jgi:hypothetical protein
MHRAGQHRLGVSVTTRGVHGLVPLIPLEDALCLPTRLLGSHDGSDRGTARSVATVQAPRLPRRTHRLERVDETRAELSVATLGPEIFRGTHQDTTDVAGLERRIALD